jgi:hypothetical protein
VEQDFALRKATAEARRERLERICGKSSSFELEQARTAEAGEGAEGPRVECKGLLPEVIADAGMETVSFPLKGPWIESFPELESRTRTHALVFKYPCTDRALLEVSAPPGFRPRPAPEPVVIDNPFGRYELNVSETADGYSVERMLRFPHLSLPANRNAGIRRFLQKVRIADAAVLHFDAAGAD